MSAANTRTAIENVPGTGATVRPAEFPLLHTNITPEQANAMIADPNPVFILDLRSAAEFAESAIPGAISVPTLGGQSQSGTPGMPAIRDLTMWIATTFPRIGSGDNARIIVYSDDGDIFEGTPPGHNVATNTPATNAVLALMHMGFNNVHHLTGGYDAWAALSGKIDTPMPTFVSAGAATAARTVTWPAVTGATGYTMYLYARAQNAPRFPLPGETLDEQIAAGLVTRVARATNVAPGEVHDIRFMNFEAVGGNTWVINPTPLPFPQGALQRHTGTSATDYPYAVAPGNLMPGAYWVRVQAVAANAADNSDLSAWWVPTTGSQLQNREHPLVVGIGPTQAKAFMEARNPGAPNQGFRNIDVRPNGTATGDERNNEGIIRFSERHINIQNVNVETGVTTGAFGSPDLFGLADVRTVWTDPNEPLLFY